MSLVEYIVLAVGVGYISFALSESPWAYDLREWQRQRREMKRESKPSQYALMDECTYPDGTVAWLRFELETGQQVGLERPLRQGTVGQS